MPRGKTPQQVYREEILEREPGLERAVLQVVSWFIGEMNAIQKPRLLGELLKMGHGKNLKPDTFERKVRLAIVALRKEGILICASSGEGGYYIAKDRAEYDAFIQVEYLNKITDMKETVDAMDAGAKRKFGGQMSFGI